MKKLTPIQMDTLSAAKENFKKFINPKNEKEEKVKAMAIENIKKLEPSFLDNFKDSEKVVAGKKKEKAKSNKEKEAENISLELSKMIGNNTYSKFGILKHFKFDYHKDEEFRYMSMGFARLAMRIVKTEGNDIAEKVIALRRLLESKTSALRMLV